MSTTSRSAPTATRYTWRGRRLAVGLGGGFNVANSLAAATTADVLGIDADDIVAGLAAAEAVPGRFERIEGARWQPCRGRRLCPHA